MFKKLILIYFFSFLCSSNTYASDDYKIIVKVNMEIISSHDMQKEKDYLSALNPQILSIPEEEIKKITKQSLIREIIKKDEVDKFYDIDYGSLQNLIPLAKNLYTRLDINSEEEFKIYLAKYDLNLNYVLKKLAIESNWNALIYQKYKDQVNINKDEIKKKLELKASIVGKEKLYLLSEIVFSPKNKKEYADIYKKIIDTIKKENFRSAATIYSSSDTAKFGGEIGWVGKNDISEKIYKQLSTLKINEFTKPIKIGTGFLLIYLDGIKEEERENNLNEQLNNIVVKETNRQLNQYSTIYYKKLEKKSFIYEN